MRNIWKKAAVLLILLTTSFFLDCCARTEPETTLSVEDTAITETDNDNVKEISEERAEIMAIKITAGEHTITATLYDNAAGRALWEKLPLTLPMMNLYGREMCYRFGAGALPENEAADMDYEVGDISYWPPAGSLVILYGQNGEVFEQQPIGHTDDDISFFDGMSDTEILFERMDDETLVK